MHQEIISQKRYWSERTLRYHAAHMAHDFYEVLGVERNASQEDIKSAYRKLSKEWHPDKHKGEKEAEQKYKKINEAYETLGNPKKRQMYDQFGAAGAQAGAGFSGFEGFQGFRGFGAEDLGGFSDIFESFFGGGRGTRARAQREQRGGDIEVAITVPFDDVVHGAKRTLSLRKQQKCSVCDGRGAQPGSKTVSCSTCGGTGQVTRTVQSFFGTLQQNSVCTECHGSGTVPEEACKRCGGEGRVDEVASVTVEVPAGIQDGQTLRLRGQGHAGRQKAAAGDLFIHVRVEEDARFERDGDDVRSEQMISVPDAVLGTEIEVETVHGGVRLKVPAGTQPAQVFRLKGKGMPVLGSSRHGDHYVTVQVEIPRKLSRREKQLLEEWKNVSQ